MSLVEKLKSLFTGKLPDEELEKALRELEAEMGQAPSAPPSAGQAPVPSPSAPSHSTHGADPAMAQQLEAIRRQMEALQQALLEEKKAREEAVRALEEQRKKERQRQIEELVQAAIKEGKIEPAKADAWKQRLEANFELTRQILEDLPPAAKAEPKSGEPSDQQPGAPTGLTPDAVQRAMEQARLYLKSKIQAQA